MEMIPLMLGMIMSTLVGAAANQEQCEELLETPSRTYTKFVVGTKIKYSCVDGYRRRSGPGGTYICDSSSGEVKWEDKSNKGFKCKKHSGTKEEDGVSSAANITEHPIGSLGDPSRDINETVPRDFCTVQFIPNAYFILRNFPLGLEYRDCQDQTGPCWLFRCMHCNNVSTWINVTEGCITRTIESTLPEKDSGTSGFRQMEIAKAACISIVVIVVIIVLGIFVMKEWQKKSRKKRSEDKNLTSAEEARTQKDPVDTDREPLNEKQ